MAENSKIEWCDNTFNPWVGCTKVSPACDNCYAESWAKRSGLVEWGNNPRRRTSDANWRKPLKWNREAEAAGIRPKVFCCSLADVFDNKVPSLWQYDLFKLIDDTPHLDWLLLTKRIGNLNNLLGGGWRACENVWLGITVINQEEVDRDVPKLLEQTWPAKLFLSIEPMLGPISLRRVMTHGGWYDALAGWRDVRQSPAPEGIIDWVICGGESGSNARTMNPDWARSIRDQCRAAGVAFFMKQMTKKAPIPDDLLIRQFPEPRNG